MEAPTQRFAAVGRRVAIARFVSARTSGR